MNKHSIKFLPIIMIILISCDKFDNSSSPLEDTEADDEQTTDEYTIEIDSTGVFHLIVFQSSISSLEDGDLIGVFDISGITNYNDCSSQIGEILVGASEWNGEQVEISAIGSIDFCDFCGVQLPGYIAENTIVIRIWDQNQQEEFETELTFSIGTGHFNDLITGISEITLK